MEAGVIHSVSKGPPLFTQPLFQYRRSSFQYRPDSLHVESYLHKPTSVAIASTGELFVGDEGSGCIVVFDSTGVYKTSFGQRGSGPGEFQSLRIQSIHADLLSVFDNTLLRTSIFHTIKGFINSYQVPYATGRITELNIDTTGLYICNYFNSRYSLYHRTDAAIISVVDSTGNEIANIMTPWVKTFSFDVDKSGPHYLRIAFSPLPVVQYIVGSNLILLSTGEEPTLRLFSTNGSLQRIISINIPRSPITQLDKAQVLRGIDSLIVQTGDESHAYVKKMIKFPQRKAFWSSVFVDDKGFYWLRSPHQYETYIHGGPSFLILSPEGEYLGYTRWPIRSGKISCGKLIYIEINNESQQRTPVIYNLVPNVPGLKY